MEPQREKPREFDCLVLGAGMVGISAALHLLKKGRSVALIDRRGPAEETSYGNAGLIQTEAYAPYAFPRDMRLIWKVLTGRSVAARLDWSATPEIAPFLFAYWRYGAPDRVAASARAMAPLIDAALDEHEALMQEAGVAHELRRLGYLRVFRDEAALENAAAAQAAETALFGAPYETLDASGLAALEPNLKDGLVGALHLTHPAHAGPPGALGQAYAARFEAQGGVFIQADALSLSQAGAGWRVETPAGGASAQEVVAQNVVAALGPWTMDLLKRYGLRAPFGVKRGYHRHFSPSGNARLSRVVVDEDNGVVLAPMPTGIRVTTGAEFARRDAPASSIMIDRAEPVARGLFPLADAQDAPWMGARPCFPDLLPMIGPVPGHQGLWADFGHQHLGYTLGPATGRLIAEMIVGETPFADPRPFRLDRF